jgi:hypothetical protein
MEDTKIGKDKSQKITKATSFGTTIGDLRLYNEDLTPREFDSNPMITITAAEDLKKFQYGIIRIDINDCGGKQGSYLVQIDGLMSIVYSVYAKTLNDLRKPSFRQKTVRMWGIFRKLFERFKKK